MFIQQCTKVFSFQLKYLMLWMDMAHMFYQLPFVAKRLGTLIAVPLFDVLVDNQFVWPQIRSFKETFSTNVAAVRTNVLVYMVNVSFQHSKDTETFWAPVNHNMGNGSLITNITQVASAKTLKTCQPYSCDCFWWCSCDVCGWVSLKIWIWGHINNSLSTGSSVGGT